MSASAALTARAVELSAAAAANLTNMEEEEEQQQQTELVDTGADNDKKTIADDSDVLDDDMVLLEKPEEADMATQQEEVDAQLRAMAVSTTTRSAAATPTTGGVGGGSSNGGGGGGGGGADTAPSTATSTGTRSAGESIDGRDRLKPFIRTCAKFESGSGSGDQDGMISMEDGVDIAAKKRKTRRGKPKHRKLKPYSKQQLSYQQRLRCRATSRSNKPNARQPPAPYNTTQFLMEDHNDLPDLDEKIAGSSAVVALASEVHSHFSKPIAPPRTRDSSFSIDSDEDFFYSSPEDEEEFQAKEFSTAYEDLHAERLGALTKSELIQEYIQLEARVDLLTKRLRSKSSAFNNQHDSGNKDTDPESAKKLKVLQQRIDELHQQNEQLRRENEILMRKQKRAGSPMSSVDSESDSESSSSDSNCSCNHNKTSPGSSPVPASYHARRDKMCNRRKNSSVSSVATDSTTGESSCDEEASSPKRSATTPSSLDGAAATTTSTATTTSSSTTATTNGHATSFEIVALPT